jgi:hypothetical protein
MTSTSGGGTTLQAKEKGEEWGAEAGGVNENGTVVRGWRLGEENRPTKQILTF